MPEEMLMTHYGRSGVLIGRAVDGERPDFRQDYSLYGEPFGIEPRKPKMNLFEWFRAALTDLFGGYRPATFVNSAPHDIHPNIPLQNENLSREYIEAGMPGWPTTRNVIFAEPKNLESA
jgi:hypothetical protein